MNISREKKLQNFRDMRGLIADHRKNHNRFPTTEEFVELTGMHETTARGYKRVILAEDKKKLLAKFQDEMIVRVGDAVDTLDKNIKMLEGIRDGENNNAEKMIAAKAINESKMDVIRVMRDGTDFIGITDDDSNEDDDDSVDSNTDNVSDKQEHIHGETNSKEIESTSS